MSYHRLPITILLLAALSKGGMVATFKNKMEQQIAADFFKGRPDYEHPLLYIGLDRLDDLKTFKWIDNEEPYPEYIEKPIPTNVGVDCTSYDTFDLIIGPAFCTINLPFFCELR